MYTNKIIIQYSIYNILKYNLYMYNNFIIIIQHYLKNFGKYN